MRPQQRQERERRRATDTRKACANEHDNDTAQESTGDSDSGREEVKLRRTAFKSQ